MITNTTTIRLEIEKGIRQKGHSLSSFGKLAGINRGIISGILNGNPPKSISIRQLDLMAEALGHPEGWMYEYYVDECFINEKADWRRIKAFLLRCTEIGRYDCIQAVLDRLMEDLSNTVSVFGLAEELYEEGKIKESIPFYECVIENEKHQHSERLAISHYRVFRASIGEDTEKSLKAIIRFEPYRNRLPENLMLDALLQLCNVYYTLTDWKMMEYHADELLSLSKLIYQTAKNEFEKIGSYQPLKTERHLVVYYGQSYLLKSVALEFQKKYEQAKEYITHYQDLNWFAFKDETAVREINKFTNYAFANTYTLNLLMGNFQDLDGYIKFLQENPSEILTGLMIITQSANNYGVNIDNILYKFPKMIEAYKINSQNLISNIPNSNYLTLYYQLAIYYFKNANYNNGIENLLKVLALSNQISNRNKMLDCISLFEKYKSYANDEQKNQYISIILEVNKDA